MNFTKNAIMDAFWTLLEEKPYNKITVRDIVEVCRINRNTFYYHFHDIPELLETIIIGDADRLIQTYSRFNSPMDCLKPLVENCCRRKKAILHIYRSIHREVFLNEMSRILLYVVTQYVDVYTDGSDLAPADKKQLVWFYRCCLTGILLDWLNDGMNYDLLERFLQLHNLLSDLDNRIFLKPEESAN